ncbi:MAG: hypothetical protein A2W90_21360 [Bacteroidetes bacterium GWF2_42_66]|nr:MAG: hypothetical protein A2W92_02475 [Bacteroidetes bacterium GWA2_42_15]OFX98882.1 MAG: hypothetical protein A2W89_12995 [Bacteroidetes bacterium GWE2_42_39]OFY45597.1 MAG: hypothetical protein A2W90_21360 [Bacteroidetes bacterium GWF2_42_66]HBL77423.1 hypothetical protein [Prolixibacteraceae bacterium]HCU62413.1 hypothetical protein [Prolixibacteraceae bacterium]
MQLNSTDKYQKRLWITVFISVIVIFVAWKGAFVKTLTSYRQIEKTESSIESSALTVSQKNRIQSEIEQFDLALGIHDTNLPTEQTFDELISICGHIGDIRIVNFPDIHQVVVNNYKVTTIFAELEGAYSDLLKMVYQLERNEKTGRLVSVNFRKKKDHKKNKEFLSITLLLQNYEIINPR